MTEHVELGERLVSDSDLPISTLRKYFTQHTLEKTLAYFTTERIPKEKVVKHLQGSSLVDDQEVANFPDINSASNDTGWPALHVAAAGGHSILTEALLLGGGKECECAIVPHIPMLWGTSSMGNLFSFFSG